MRGRIVRCIDPKSSEKTASCALCGDIGRKNKSRFEVELPCGHKAEIPICRPCSGEDKYNMLYGVSVELPGMLPYHYHIVDQPSRTFFDFVDCLNWIKYSFIGLAAPKETEDGYYRLKVPFSEIKFFRCDGASPMKKD